MRGLLIDAFNIHHRDGLLRQIELDPEAGLGDVRRFLSSPMRGVDVSAAELAMTDPAGNDYWVDEDGISRGVDTFVLLRGAHQPFWGSLVVTGPESHDGFTDARIGLATLRSSMALVQVRNNRLDILLGQPDGWSFPAPSEFTLHPGDLGCLLRGVQAALDRPRGGAPEPDRGDDDDMAPV